MMIHYRQHSPIHAEVWAETWDKTENDFRVISDGRLLIANGVILIDSLTVFPPWQRMGVGTAIVKYLQAKGPVQPIDVLPSAEEFWDKVTPGWRQSKIKLPKEQGQTKRPTKTK